MPTNQNQIDLFSYFGIKPEVRETHTPLFKFLNNCCLFFYGKTKDTDFQIQRQFEYENRKLFITIQRQRGIKNNKIIYDNFLNYQDEKVFHTLMFQCINGNHQTMLSNNNVILKTSIYKIKKDYDKGLSTQFIKSSLDKLLTCKITIEDEQKILEWQKNTSIIKEFIHNKKTNELFISFSDDVSKEILKITEDTRKKEIALANYRTIIDIRSPMANYIYKTLIFNHNNYSSIDPTRQQFHQYNIWHFLKQGGFTFSNKTEKQNIKRQFLKAVEELQAKEIIYFCSCFNEPKPDEVLFYLTKETVKENYNQKAFIPKTF